MICLESSLTEVPGWLRDHGVWHCPGIAESCTLETPPGRPDVTRCYCHEHGGYARARAEATADWQYAAPASVGDEYAVQLAGTMSLSSEHCYVIVHAEKFDPSTGVWLAFLGVGGHKSRNPVPRPDYRGCTRARCRVCPVGPPYCGRQRYAFSSLELATRAGVEAWRRGVEAWVEEIRAARGGTLDWGMPVEPREQPIVIVQDRAGGSWDGAAVAAGEKSTSGAIR